MGTKINKKRSQNNFNLIPNRAIGDALADGLKPDASNIPMGSFSTADASNAEAQTKQDDRPVLVAGAKNANASADALPFTASTDSSGFQSSLTPAEVSNTFAIQELNDLLANIASAEGANRKC